MSSIEYRSESFKSAAEYATKSPKASGASNAVKLELYGLYKYLTVAHKPNTKCPSVFDMSGRAKWQAWEKASTEYAGKTDEEVESNYIEVVRTLGWTENATPRVEADASKSEDKEGTHGVGMGVSVSQIARPAEDAHQAEDSLHGAVLTKDESKVEEYLRKGHSSAFDIDQKDEYGFTALHLAADRGYLPIVKLLITRGANPGVKDPDDLTAISLAQAGDHKDIVQFIEDYLASKGSQGQGA